MSYLDKNGVSQLWEKVKSRDDITLSQAKSSAAGLYIPKTLIGEKDGVASLGSDGKVPSTQLPAYVDDVLEVENFDALPKPGEEGKIYVDTSTNKTYRWSGSTYVQIKGDLVVGTTPGTAYDGGKGTKLEERITTVEEDIADLPSSLTAYYVKTQSETRSAETGSLICRVYNLNGYLVVECNKGVERETKQFKIHPATGVTFDDNTILDESMAITTEELQALLD